MVSSKNAKSAGLLPAAVLLRAESGTDSFWLLRLCMRDAEVAVSHRVRSGRFMWKREEHLLLSRRTFGDYHIAQ